MKNFFIVVSVLVAGLWGASLSYAGPLSDPYPCNPGKIGQQRIKHGIATGKLTPCEAAVLRAERAQIQQTACRLRADGQMSWRERAYLGKKTNRFRNHIARLTCNQRYSHEHRPATVRYPLCGW